jgi:alpha-methylacyl-CoA racemase
MSLLHQFLRGIKVLDLSHYLPGPMASLFLADMGATVIKVVPPSGEGIKKLGPKDKRGEPIFNSALNAGKRELVLDLKDSSDNQTFRNLAAMADILIEGFRPGTLARLGVGPPILRKQNAALIICSISGYGAVGPMAQAAGHDANYLATSGILDRNVDGMADPPLADCAGALFATTTILGALHQRSKTGIGCDIDIGLADVVMPLQLYQIAAFGSAGWIPKPGSYYINGGVAGYHDYRTLDGQRWVLGALEDKFWKAFCIAARHPEWISRHADSVPQTGLIGELTNYFSAISQEECRRIFDGVDCCLTPVLDLEKAVNSPQVVSRGLVRRSGESLQALFPAYIDGIAPDCRAPLESFSSREAKLMFAPETAVRPEIQADAPQ